MIGRLCFGVLAALWLGCASARILEVGPEKEFVFPSVAAKFANDGDVIEIDAAGDYLNDYALWTQNDLTIRGVNGRPMIRSVGLIPNGKAIWVIRGNGVRVENIEFSGAQVRDGNGAAIRLEGGEFTMSRCFVHDNENGILSGVKLPKSEVLIEESEFAFNGKGDGRTHNIYVGQVGRFILRNSYLHDAKVGHLVKSRARENYILYNRLFEGGSSYAIDISSGGYALVMGNLIHQGEDTDNWVMVVHGAEGLAYPDNGIEVVYNSFQNDRSSGIFTKVARGADVLVVNNLFSGQGDVLEGHTKQKESFKSMVKRLIFPEAEDSTTETFPEGNVQVENNIHRKNLFKVFSDAEVHLNEPDIVGVIDAASDVKGFRGNELLPTTQIKGGMVQLRKQLGQKLDIGAVEYR